LNGHLYDAGAIEAYEAPDPDEERLYLNLKRLIAEEKSEYYIIGRLHTTIFETAWALRGMDNLMVDFLIEPERAAAVLDIPFAYHKRVAEKMTSLGVDMIWLGDDMGAQDSMLISPELWRKFFKPRMAEIIASAKSKNSDVKVAYHTDGFNIPIIPDLIEIGLDVLNPIQTESMNPVELKRDFGDRLSFFGGIDVQTTLPFKTPADVASEFRSCRSSLGRGGGWICAPTHHVQLDTPLENFLALVDSIRTSGR
jgi:uroporphyrinogen decarboxylase